MTSPPDLDLDLDVVHRAQRLHDAGHDTAAACLAYQILAVLDPATVAPDAHLATLTGIYLEGIPAHHVDDNPVPERWARYAVRACKDLYGLADPHTITALHHLLWALCMSCTTTWITRRPGMGLVAAWTQLTTATTVLHGPDAAQTLHYQYQRTTALHQLGHCDTALSDAMRTWTRWHRHHGVADTTILHHIAVMLHDCRTLHEIAPMWLRAHLLVLPTTVRSQIHHALARGSTPARTAAHRAVCTRPGPAPPGTGEQAIALTTVSWDAPASREHLLDTLGEQPSGTVFAMLAPALDIGRRLPAGGRRTCHPRTRWVRTRPGNDHRRPSPPTPDLRRRADGRGQR